MSKNISLAESSTSELLFVVLKVASELGIPVWLDQGTLLGIVRDEQIIPWDNDVDISSWFEDWNKEKVSAFRSRLLSLGATSLIIPRNGAMKITWQAKQRKPGQPLELPVNLVKYRRRDGYAVRWFMKPALDLRSVVGKMVIGIPCRCLRIVMRAYTSLRPDPSANAALIQNLELVHKCLWLFRDRYLRGGRMIEAKVPEGFFTDLQEIKLNSNSALVPANFEMYLKFKYGKDWKIPRQSWTPWKHDGAALFQAKLK